jgi:hypothetical protein
MKSTYFQPSVMDKYDCLEHDIHKNSYESNKFFIYGSSMLCNLFLYEGKTT